LAHGLKHRLVYLIADRGLRVGGLYTLQLFNALWDAGNALGRHQRAPFRDTAPRPYDGHLGSEIGTEAQCKSNNYEPAAKPRKMDNGQWTMDNG
jgi:hypothetical protein